MADLTELAQSPLDHLSIPMTEQSGAQVALREIPFVPMVSLRAVEASPTVGRLGHVLGTDLPAAVGQTATAGECTTLWLGPDEWLVVGLSPTTETTSEARIVPGEVNVAALVDALGADRGAVVDVGANRTVLDLSGPRARDVLDKGCPTDLHPAAFGVGRAITTTLGPVPLLLWRVDDDSYRLLPRSSFADYVARWLLDAMAEYDEVN